jgi:hypothetical protein
MGNRYLVYPCENTRTLNIFDPLTETKSVFDIPLIPEAFEYEKSHDSRP